MKEIAYRTILTAVYLFSATALTHAQQPALIDVDNDGTDNFGLLHDHGTWQFDDVAGDREQFRLGGPDSTIVRGDYNGDGIEDYAVYNNQNGDWSIRSSTGGTIVDPFSWGFAGAIPVAGDFNGDGQNDPAVYYPLTGNWYISELDETLLGFPINWGFPGTVPVAGDYDGDGQDDLAVYEPTTGRWFIRDMDGNTIIFGEAFGYSAALPVPGDFDGDGTNDMVVYDQANAVWYGRTVDDTIILWAVKIGAPGDVGMAGNVAGGPGDEIIAYNSELRMWAWAEQSSPETQYNRSWKWPGLGDINGDGSTDIISYKDSDGTWDVLQSGSLTPASVPAWGYPGTLPAVGDFNGDGKFDPAAFDNSNGVWFIRSSEGEILLFGEQWGYEGCVPVIGDYNGDGIDDIGVYDEAHGYWHVMTVAGEVLFSTISWGGPGMVPVPGDFDGDGKHDLAVYQMTLGKWYIISTTGQPIVMDLAWGTSGMVPVPGDYDRDARDDMALFHPRGGGKWYALNVDEDIILSGVEWGNNDMIPVNGDYNGDGSADFATYEIETGRWHIRTVEDVIVDNMQPSDFEKKPVLGHTGAYTEWDNVIPLGPSGTYPVSIPYDQDWVIEADFNGMNVHTWEDKFFMEDWTKLQLFADTYGRMAIRLANRKINYTEAIIGEITTPAPPDHWARSLGGYNMQSGNHTMRLEYSYSTRTLTFYWDDFSTITGQWKFDVIKMPKPISSISVIKIQSGELRYSVGEI